MAFLPLLDLAVPLFVPETQKATRGIQSHL